MKPMEQLGVGIGWRPEIADAVERLPGLDWVEVVAENICADHLPDSLVRLRERGVRVVPHGVSLGIGGADRPDPAKLAALAERAVALGTPLITEHIAFVRTSSPALEAATCCRCRARATRWTCCARTYGSRRTPCRCRWRWRTSPR